MMAVQLEKELFIFSIQQIPLKLCQPTVESSTPTPAAAMLYTAVLRGLKPPTL